eukprot:s1934_g5.t1
MECLALVELIQYEHVRLPLARRLSASTTPRKLKTGRMGSGTSAAYQLTEEEAPASPWLGISRTGHRGSCVQENCIAPALRWYAPCGETPLILAATSAVSKWSSCFCSPVAFSSSWTDFDVAGTGEPRPEQRRLALAGKGGHDEALWIRFSCQGDVIVAAITGWMGSGSSSAYQLTKEEAAAVDLGLGKAPTLKKKVEEWQADADKSQKLEEQVTTLQKELKELQARQDIAAVGGFSMTWEGWAGSLLKTLPTAKSQRFWIGISAQWDRASYVEGFEGKAFRGCTCMTISINFCFHVTAILPLESGWRVFLVVWKTANSTFPSLHDCVRRKACRTEQI